MSSTRISEDPLERAIELPKGSNTETRAARHQLDALAKQTSNEIDEWLKKEAAAVRNGPTRLLLLGNVYHLFVAKPGSPKPPYLGQAESGWYSSVKYVKHC